MNTGIVSLFILAQLLLSQVVYACDPATNPCDDISNCNNKSDNHNCSRKSIDNSDKITGFWAYDSSSKDHKKSISREKCFCKKKVTNTTSSQGVECFTIEDLPKIIGNMNKDCQRGHDEFMDIIKIYKNTYIGTNDTMMNKFMKIANYAAKLVGTCKDIHYTLDEFPSSYANYTCPHNYINCFSDDQFFCVRKPTLNQKCSHHFKSENEISSHDIHLSEWNCLNTNQVKKRYLCDDKYYQCKGRSYDCNEATCYRSFSCDGNKASEKMSFSLENDQEFMFKMRFSDHSWISITKEKVEKIKFKYTKRDEVMLSKNMKIKEMMTENDKRISFNLVFKCTTCSSQVHLALDLNGTIPITSMYLHSKDLASVIQLIYKVFSQNDLKVQNRINSAPTSPIIFEHHFNSAEQVNHLKPMNDRKYMLKLGTKDDYLSGHLSMIIPFDSKIFFGNNNTKALVLSESELKERKLTYYDMQGKKQSYSLLKKPENLMILVEFKSLNESQLSFQTEDTVIELCKLSTNKILEAIIFTKKPISIKLNFSPKSTFLELHQISLYVLLPIIIALTVSLVICTSMLCCRGRKSNSRPASIQVVNSNEYYGEASWNDVQMEVRYPNYYYAKE